MGVRCGMALRDRTWSYCLWLCMERNQELVRIKMEREAQDIVSEVSDYDLRLLA